MRCLILCVHKTKIHTYANWSCIFVPRVAGPDLIKVFLEKIANLIASLIKLINLILKFAQTVKTAIPIPKKCARVKLILSTQREEEACKRFRYILAGHPILPKHPYQKKTQTRAGQTEQIKHNARLRNF